MVTVVFYTTCGCLAIVPFGERGSHATDSARQLLRIVKQNVFPLLTLRLLRQKGPDHRVHANGKKTLLRSTIL